MRIAIFYVLLLLFIEVQTSWAISITEPKEGAKLLPGTTIRIVVRPDPGEKWHSVYMGLDLIPYDEVQGVYIDKVTIQEDADIGWITIKLLAIDQSGKKIEVTRRVEIILPANVVLKRLTVDRDTIFLYKLPKGSNAEDIREFETRQIYVYGIYSDGVKRELTKSSSGTIYISSNEKVASVDLDGKVTALSIGAATISVKNGEQKTEVKVVVKPY